MTLAPPPRRPIADPAGCYPWQDRALGARAMNDLMRDWKRWGTVDKVMLNLIVLLGGVALYFLAI